MAFTATQYLLKGIANYGHDRRYGWQLHRPGQYQGYDLGPNAGQ
jgi:hypothetical protein